jgi:hypothetical protein
MKLVRWLAAGVCILGLATAARAGVGIGGKLWYVSFLAEHLQATVGYRVKKFLNWDNKDETADLTQSGVAASASFLF